MMTPKQRMLATINGKSTDRMPYAPRLDLWYNAQKQAETLPAKYRHATLMELTEDLDFAYHAVIPNFKDLRRPEDEVHRALGMRNLWSLPYRTQLENVEFQAEYHGDETIVTYRTPVGTIRTRVLYTDDMRRAGITISHIAEHAIKQVDDYRVVAHIFENARVEPNVDGYREFYECVGERGLAVAFVDSAASPMHLLQRIFMPMDRFFFELNDHPQELARCAESIGGYFERVFDVLSDCPAEVFMLGSNYDSSVTYPPFFREHIFPG